MLKSNEPSSPLANASGPDVSGAEAAGVAAAVVDWPSRSRLIDDAWE